MEPVLRFLLAQGEPKVKSTGDAENRRRRLQNGRATSQLREKLYKVVGLSEASK